MHAAINITKPKNHYFCEVTMNAMKNRLTPNSQPPTSFSDFNFPFSDRFGFNGQEKDDEIYGEGASYTAEFWQYDSRLGRRWNVDPVLKAWKSPYATLANENKIMDNWNLEISVSTPEFNPQREVRKQEEQKFKP